MAGFGFVQRAKGPEFQILCEIKSYRKWLWLLAMAMAVFGNLQRAKGQEFS